MSSGIRWAVFFWVVGAVVAMVGEPQPLAIITAAASAATGTVIALQHISTRNP